MCWVINDDKSFFSLSWLMPKIYLLVQISIEDLLWAHLSTTLLPDAKKKKGIVAQFSLRHSLPLIFLLGKVSQSILRNPGPCHVSQLCVSVG